MEPVPPALKDRMETIEVPGYTQTDKLTIARKYLVPRQLKEHGVTEKQVRIPNKTIEAIIDEYTREAGVRTLERTIASVIRGVAAKIAEEMPPENRSKKEEARSKKPPSGNGAAGGPTPASTQEKSIGNRQSAIGNHTITVLPADLQKILGPTRFESELAQRTATPGVVTGLAYTPVGGEILFIEATQMPGKGTLQLTGQIGDVMKESVHAAFSLLKHNAKHLGLDPDLFAKTDVHVHVPAGAIPKDGPSAGVAMYTALASLFTGKSVPPDVAMTGEITLRGLVLPIGGVKEKVIAAQRAGIKTVILPERNRKNLVEIREEVRKALHFQFANTVDDILKIVFAHSPGVGGGKAKSSRRRRPRDEERSPTPLTEYTCAACHGYSCRCATCWWSRSWSCGF